MKKILLSFIPLTFILASAIAQPTVSVPSGDVSGTWGPDTTYQVTGDIEVPEGDTLNIAPGTTVEFMGHYRLTVSGALVAIGAPGDSIRFTKSDTNGLYDWATPNGSWNGIFFDGLGADGYGHLSYCVVEFSNTYQDCDKDSCKRAALDVYYGGLILENSAIRYNYSYHGSTRIYYKTSEIRNNMFYKNHGYQYSGGIALYTNDDYKIVEGNTFLKNKGGSGGAIYAWRSGLKVIIKNNFISQNEANWGGGIYMTSESGPQVVQNIMVNNTALGGGAIYMQNSGKVLINNTICNNYGGNGGGIYISDPTLLDAKNNILWGNKKSGNAQNQIYAGTDVSATFRYTVLEPSPGQVEGPGIVTFDSLETGDPSISDATSAAGKDYPSDPGDWKVGKTSSCLNIGTRDYFQFYNNKHDYFGDARIKYGIIDIGAHEFSLPVSSWSGTYNADYIWMADTIKITGKVTINGTLDIVAGVVVKYMDHDTLKITDKVQAFGTVDDPILFTMNDTNGFANRETTDGRWARIDIDDADNSIFRYCNFEYGEGLDIRNSNNITIEYCIFENCMGNPGLLYTSSATGFYIRYNIIRNNDTKWEDSWIRYAVNSAYCSDYYFTHNKIYNNRMHAIEIGANNAYVNNNLIYNNMSGPHMGEADNLYFFNNTIANHVHWGISFNKGTGIIANNLFYGNGDSYDEDIRTLPYVDELKVYNNILQDEPFQAAYIIYDQNLITDPLLKNPTIEKGPVEDILQADYNILSISPAINSGRNTIPDHTLPTLDIDGNNRILDKVVDIGAFEHTGQKPVIITQPAGGNICEGLSKTLTIDTEPEDTLLYQWQKDGEDIAGEKETTLILDPITLEDAGNYRCVVSNSFGTTPSDQVYLNVSAEVEILTESSSEWIPSDEVTTLSVNASGSEPMKYQWYMDGEMIDGADLPHYEIEYPDSSNEGIYSCIVTNTCGSDTTEDMNIYLIPQICMVTIDTTTGKNLIVWEKKTKAPIFAYKVLRESVAAGIYDELATVPFDDLSVYEDSIADPTSQAYLYKIIAVDNADNQTDVDLCKPHKTIHLLVSLNEEYQAAQLSWDNYYGFAYQTYVIFRSETGTGFEQVKEISASLNSWTDTDTTISGDPFYRIAVLKPGSCYPEGLGGSKAGAGPYHHAMSNLDKNKFQAGGSAPDTITLDNHSIAENNMPGTLVGKLSTVDADTADIFTYYLIEGEGDDDNSSFTILANLLLAVDVFDYEVKSQYSTRIRSVDPKGLSDENIFLVNITDVNESVGIEDASRDNLKIYPNPFTRSTTVKFPNPEAEKYTLYILDLSGKVMRIDHEIRASQYVIERGSLGRGLYLFRLEGPTSYRGRFIIE